MAEPELNILLLHAMGSRSRWLVSVADRELALLRYAPGHRFLVHNIHFPIPDFVKDVRFDAIVLSSTFINRIQSPQGYENLKANYAFLKDHVTIALPQDDYWCSEERDGLYTEFGIDKIYPVCPSEHWPELFPRYLATGRPISLGFTSYVSPFFRERTGSPLPWKARGRDVIYRAKGRPSFPNRLGTVKAEIGERFKRAVRGRGLNLDISTKDHDIIPGSRWLDFLEDSRATLGSNSGSSLLVRGYSMIREMRAHLSRKPGATPEELERMWPSRGGGNGGFTAISPRNVEAGLLQTLQLLVPGAYGGILEPWRDYVPLAEDCSNIEEVLSCLKDEKAAWEITVRCRQRILETKEIQVETLIADIIRSILDCLPKDHVPLDPKAFQDAIDRHRAQMGPYEALDPALEKARAVAKKILPDRAKVLIRKILGKPENVV